MDNPIHQWLDTVGVPWRLTRGELIARYGLEPDSECWPGSYWFDINIPVPILDDMIGPLIAQGYKPLSPIYPVLQFRATVSCCDGSEAGIRRLKKKLETNLGRTSIHRSGNETLTCQWWFGAASVTLETEPFPLEQDSHPTHANVCYISIHTGYRPSLSPAEQSWLESFVPVAPIQMSDSDSLASIADTPANEDLVAFVRDPGDADLSRVFGYVGHSADGAALLFCSASCSSSRSMFYVVPVASVICFRVERLFPARGCGGSTLRLECTATGSKGTIYITICWEYGPDSLNTLAERIAKSVGCSFMLEPYANDC